tara:strand:+ start:504 stop:644 length:141 start_codon:yes stop_codon:yes gene_type:complete
MAIENNKEIQLDTYSVEELEARFEMEAIVDDGGADTDGSCECKITW